jgi:hypothetical protein
MKISILKLTTVVFITGTILISCNTTTQKADNVQSADSETNNHLDTLSAEYVTEIDTFKKQTSDKISANNQIISNLRVKLKHATKETKAGYEKAVDELDRKNGELKKKMEVYKAEGKEKWKIFKTDFGKDMDTLDNEFKKLTAKL